MRRADELERRKREKLLRIARCNPESFALTASTSAGDDGADNTERGRRDSNHDDEGGDDGAAPAPEIDDTAASTREDSSSGSEENHSRDGIGSDDETLGNFVQLSNSFQGFLCYCCVLLFRPVPEQQTHVSAQELYSI